MKMFHTVMVLAFAGSMLIACGPKPADTTTTTTTTTPAAVTTPAAATTPAAMATTPAPGGDMSPAAGGPPAGSLAAQVDDSEEAAGGEGAEELDGNTVRFPDAGIQFNVPAGWVASNEGGNVSVATPDGAVGTLFIFPKDVETAKVATDAVMKNLDSMLSDIKPEGEPEEGEMAGMKWVTIRGTGMLKGAATPTPVRFAVDLVDAKQPVMALTVASEEAWKAHEAEISALNDSFVALEGGDAAGGGTDASPAPGGDEAGAGGDEAGGDEAAGGADASPDAGEGGH